jgi:SOS-response transcriptional repressor LexA
MEVFWNRVKDLLKDKKKTQEWLADEIATPKFTLYGWIKNNTQPPVGTAVKIASVLETSVEYLVEGNPDIQPEIVINKMENWTKDAYDAVAKSYGLIEDLLAKYRKIATIEKIEKSLDDSWDVRDPEPVYNAEPIYGQFFLNDKKFKGEDMIVLPILGQTAAGMPIDAQETLQFPRRLLRGNETEYFCLEIKGYSMTEAGIDDGDHVILRRTDVPENERIMLIQHEGKTTLKKLKIKNGITYLCWENGTNHEPIVVNSDGYTVQGALVHIIKTP